MVKTILRKLPFRLDRGRVRIIIALALVVGASAMFWASRDYSVVAPDWEGRVRGITYSPSHLLTEKDQENVTPEQIDRDMAQLSQLTSRIRTYTVAHGLDKVPEIARRYGIRVSLGIWISPDLDENEKEIETGIRVALENRRNVDRVIVGNESIQFNYVTPSQLNDYIRRVREALPSRIKVSTAETWSSWLLTPEIGQYTDVIFVHLLPYWEGVGVRDGINFLGRAYNNVQAEFPDKPIVIGETGWPSEGRTRRNAEASMANEAYYVRAFMQEALDKGYDYYLMEAYDQPWKDSNEGAVGAYWGIFDALGKPKYQFAGMLRTFPQWRSYAVLAAFFSLTLGFLIMRGMPRVRQAGYLVMAGLVYLVTTGLLMLIDAMALDYVAPADIALIIAISPLVLLASAVILTEGIELAASLWRVERRQVQAAIPLKAPRVSIHVPTFNEPPQMVIETLDALSRLDYENFEVILLDNNTPDEGVWRPVEAHCARLGSRFRFYHFDDVKGFKAGALNIALRLTDPSAEYVGVIDSDYQVQPYWLRRALPLFADRDIALVQGPQDYRDGAGNLFKSMAFEEYRGFFHIGMVERNEHDAIIQHGTMTIVRKDALEQVDGWSEWCITEDTELGLKLFEAGYSAAYIPQSMGTGLIPDTLEAYMSQRYRWVYGAMQIMKRHARPIFRGKSQLSWAQRYQFLTGWLPWLSDGLSLLVTLVALVWTALVYFVPRYFDVPMPALSAAALALFLAKTSKTWLLYPKKVGSGMRGAAMASVSGLSLTHTVAKAVLTGLFTSGKPFLRTPKCEDQAMLSQALRVVWQETTLLCLCLLAILSVANGRGFDEPAAVLWMVMLFVQGLPFAATVYTATISAHSNARLGNRPQIPAPPPVLSKAA